MWDKCMERYYIYLNKPSFTDTQILEYQDNGIGVYFIDINWIMQQDLKPNKFNYTLITDYDYEYELSMKFTR
jgi:hypothetical protein